MADAANLAVMRMSSMIASLSANGPIAGLVFVVLLLIAFATERFPPVTVAVCGAAVMIALGWIGWDEVSAAFANPAPIAIGAFFILSGALVRTGTIEALASTVVRRAARQPRLDGRADQRLHHARLQARHQGPPTRAERRLGSSNGRKTSI